MVSLKSYPIPHPNAVGRLVGGEAVIVLPGKGQVKVLNEVGARIWSLADGTRSIEEIAQILCDEFTVGLDEAQSDTQAFVDRLVSLEIITLSDNSAQR